MDLHPRLIIPSLLILLGIGGLFVAYHSQQQSPVTLPMLEEPAAPSEQASSTDTGRYRDIESYVTTSISSLSPIKERLGGTFQVTKIETHDGSGTVEYEDGHDAYVADFTYAIAESGAPSVDSFTIRTK